MLDCTYLLYISNIVIKGVAFKLLLEDVVLRLQLRHFDSNLSMPAKQSGLFPAHFKAVYIMLNNKALPNH